MIIDRALFAQECVRQGVFFGVNPHFLLTVAQFRTGISDDSQDGEIGPFRIRQSQWDANCESDEFDVHFTSTQIGSSGRQCAVVGLMAHRAFDIFVSRKGRNPTVRELYVQQWTDADVGKSFDDDLKRALDLTAPLLAPAAEAVLGDSDSTIPIKDIGEATDRPISPGDTSGAPQWYSLALQEIGTHEENDNSGAAIARYRQLAQCGSDHDPWCAIFANAMFALCQPLIPGTKSPSSQSFRDSPNFKKLDGPAMGAVVVFWRGSPRSGLGHVGFYRGETSDSVYVLGGNEDDMVQIEPVSKHQLIGYWWPVSQSDPAIGSIAVPPGTPKHQTTKVT